MGTRRRMMAESEESWTPPMDNYEGGSIDDVFAESESIFSNKRAKQGPDLVTPEQEKAPERPTEGPVRWKMADGKPVISAEAPLGGNLRRMLVAAIGPTGGVLVADAVRDVKTGKTRHLEPMRSPTPSELAELRENGQSIPAPPARALAGVDGSSMPLWKVGLAAAVVGAVGFGIFKWVNKDGD